MTAAGTVAGDERQRTFLALRLPDDVLAGFVEWEGSLEGGRRVPRENLHVTLAFLGHRPVSELPAICDALRGAAAAARPPVLAPTRYRETRSVGMVVLSDEDGRAATLARDLHGRLERLAVYEPEKRPWLPHVTVLRFRERLGCAPSSRMLRRSCRPTLLLTFPDRRVPARGTKSSMRFR